MHSAPLTLVFLEHPDEVDAYLVESQTETAALPHHRIVALNPKTLADLRRRGHAAEDTLVYFDAAARMRAQEQSARMTEWVRGHFRFEDNWGVTTAYEENLLWYTRWMAHYLLWGIEVLSNAAAITDASTFAVYRPQRVRVSGPLLNNRERYFGLLAERFAAVRGLELQRRIVDPQASLSQRVRDIARRGAERLAANRLTGSLHREQLRRLQGHDVALFTSRHYRMAALAERVTQTCGAPPVLATDWGTKQPPRRLPAVHPTRPFVAEARLSLLEAVGREDHRSLRDLKAELNAFAESVSDASDVFVHLGVSFADLLAEKVRRGIAPSIIRLHKRTAAMHTLLGIIRPSLVFSNGARMDDIAMGELCHMAQIPAMMVTHGTHTPPSNDTDRYEWGEHGKRLIDAPYAFTALQSPLAEGYRKAFPTGSKHLRTGPLIWTPAADRSRSAALRQRMLGGVQGRVIVHVSTPKPFFSMRFHIHETYDEYLEAVRDLAAAVEALDDTSLVVRFRPVSMLGVDDLRSLVPFSDKVILSGDEPLAELLGFTDLLVGFSSTVIEEAIQNHVPVLLYGGEGRYRHVEAVEVTPEGAVPPSAVYWVRRRQHLTATLPRIFGALSETATTDDLFRRYVYGDEKRLPLRAVLEQMVS